MLRFRTVLPLPIVAFCFALSIQKAEACGCFAPPNAAEPVLQAGEYVLFAHDGENVTMHVQIQYAGSADEFGWLVPLPSVPQLEVGADDVFLELVSQTNPRFRLDQLQNAACAPFNALDAGARGFSDGSAPQNAPPSNVVVQRQSVGPFDTAVLRADDRTAMLEWLGENRFFIPDALANAVDPYVHEGAYFLALKLRSDKDAGDIQPIVLTFASELPMIPLILTRVGANEDMPVFVWMLGEARAIPRNYRHTVINEEHIDWFNGANNYREVVSRAVDEAENGHSFVTEYAGSTSILATFATIRYNNREALASTTDPGAYVIGLRAQGFTFGSALLDILRETFVMPEGVKAAGFSEDQFFANLDWFLGNYRDQNPEQFDGADFTFDPEALTDRVWTTIAEPMIAAGELISGSSKITRLFTTISPSEMTADPVFSFNPDLPDVSNSHVATYERGCNASGEPTSRGLLTLPDGRRFMTASNDWISTRSAPYSRRIELLREEGPAEVEVDNSDRLTASGLDDGQGANCACTSTERRSASAIPLGGLLLLIGVGLRRRR